MYKHTHTHTHTHKNTHDIQARMHARMHAHTHTHTHTNPKKEGMWLNIDIACVSMCSADPGCYLKHSSCQRTSLSLSPPFSVSYFRFTPSVLKFYACQLPKPYRHIRYGLVCAVSWSTSSTCLAMWLLNAWVSATTCCHASLAQCSSCEVMAATPSPKPTSASTSSSPSVARRCLATQRRRRMGGCTQRSAWKPSMAT